MLENERILFFDTETTGLWKDHLRLDDDRQPNPVQLGALFWEEGIFTAEIDAIIKPEGWTIPAEAASVHGITTERAHAEGLSLADAIDGYLEMRNRATVLVAHNSEYDRLVMRRAIWLAGRSLTPHPNLRLACTKTMAEPVTKIQPTDRMKQTGYGNKFKSPKLSECVSILLGEEMQDAHSAAADCRYCARVFFKLIEMGVEVPWIGK